VDAPAAQAAGGAVPDVRREPSLDRVSLQRMRRVVAAQQSLRRMTGAAMAGTLDEIGPAIPFLGFLRVGAKYPALIVESVPHPHRGADIEGKRQLIGDDRMMGRRDRAEIRPDR